MSVKDEDRPNPEDLLKMTRPRRGHLKLFLGAAPGVGKTYAMLTEAHEKRREGLDVLIGWVDTHKRPDTEALLAGLPVLPRLIVDRHGHRDELLDIDAIARRRPALVVIDEMPHTNPPGGRHPKRWQDIEDILDLGIDVYSAVNIQHLESLNGIVDRITGVDVRETIPDRVFDSADEVRLVDLPPDDLIKRLEAGKIYLPDVVERARNHYFRKSNLIALRELSLRLMADRIDSQIKEHRSLRVTEEIDASTFGLLLVVEELGSEDTIREAGRMARSLGSSWHVVWFDKPGASISLRRKAADMLAFAEGLGAETAMLSGGFGRMISAYAREHNLSLVAIAPRGWIKSVLRRRDLSHALPEANLVILPARGKRMSFREKLAAELETEKNDWVGMGIASIVLLLLTLLFSSFGGRVQPTNFAMCYLLVSFLAAVRFGMRTATWSVILSIVCFDLVLVEPLGSFAVSDLQYLFTFFVMLTVGVVSSRLVAKREIISREAQQREREMSILYDTAKALAPILDAEQVYDKAREVLKKHLGIVIEFWEPTEEGDLKPKKTVLTGVERAVMKLALEHRRPAGRATMTLGSSNYLYFPLVSAEEEALGVIVMKLTSDEDWANPVNRRLIKALMTQFAQSLERLRSMREAREMLANLENERLRHSLVQSLSHDLKTPLTVLTAQAEAILGRLKKEDIDGAFDETVELIRASERMVRLVNNLLDMAKLQSGKFEPHLDWIPADELIGASLASMKARLHDFRVQVKIADDCPMLYCDQTLLDRLLFNLLDNAAKYCPFGSTVVIEAAPRGNAVMLSVSDNGPGFPTGDPQRLFDPFRRGHRESDITGVGLGLAICRSIARVHNADLLALPSSMGGASFVLMLPHVPLPPMEDEGEILGDEDLPSTVPMPEITKKNKLPSAPVCDERVESMPEKAIAPAVETNNDNADHVSEPRKEG